jgi:hypothetical protein
MTKKTTLLFLCLVPFIKSAIAQKDTTNAINNSSKNKFSILIGTSLSGFGNKKFDFSYENCFVSPVFSPLIEIVYWSRSNFNHSIIFGGIVKDFSNSNNRFYFETTGRSGGDGGFKNFNVSYSLQYVFFKQKKVMPFISLSQMYSFRDYDFKLYLYYSSTNSYLKERTNLFLLQLPIGFIIKKPKLTFKFEAICNIFAFTKNKREYTFLDNYGDYTTNYFNYNKTYFLLKKENNKFIFNGLQIKLGYNF